MSKTQHLVSALAALVALSIALSCGPKPPVDESAVTLTAHSVRVSEVDDGRMVIAWETSGTSLIAGYNIYISESPDGMESYNPAPFPGDTDPSDGIEHYEAGGLENGRIYFISVRVIYPDRSLSEPTDPVMGRCGPSGEFELGVRFHSETDGFSFSRGAAVAADDVANDLYFFPKDGSDLVSSPDQYDAFLRKTRLTKTKPYPSVSDLVKRMVESATVPSSRELAIKPGDIVWLRTPDGGDAILQVEEISGRDRSRTVEVSYTYFPASSATP